MMKEATKQKLTEAMAAAFNIPLEVAQRPGTILVESADKKADSWHTLFPIGKQIRVSTSPQLMQPLQNILAEFSAGHPLTLDEVVSALGTDNFRTGTEEFYVLEEEGFAPFMPMAPYTVRQLTTSDQTAFDAFQANCPPDDVDMADVGLDHEAAFAAFAGDRIVAVASGYEWYGCLDVGILTDPAYRGKGLGKAAVSACCEYFLPRERPVFYRHDTKNIGSGKIAVGLGFTHITTVGNFRRK
ncbi:MAG: GNAT family N-acetyltransferase [Anaerolineae bacterium]|nr:GNAT family N-acetyltransferase [Anaerolineae bacterium]